MQSSVGNADTLVLLLIVVAGLGVVIALVVRGRRRKANTGQQSWPGAYGPAPQMSQQVSPPGGYGKRCPTCRSIYADETLAFCLSDGSTLELVPMTPASIDTNATYAYPTANGSNVAPTIQYHPNTPPDRKR